MSKLAMGFYMLAAGGHFKWLPDKTFLKIQYRLNMHKKLNLENPKTFTEKLQWMKIYDRNPDYIPMVDKYAVKEYVAEKIGEEYIIPTLGVWDRFDEIDFDKLPDMFVLKCTHDSGSIVICKDKKTFNMDAARRKINAHLKANQYDAFREWPYKDVKPRIIAEPYLEDTETKELRDYKLYTFNGTVKIIGVYTGRKSSAGTCTDFFDENYQHLPFVWVYPKAKRVPEKPDRFEEMKTLAEKLARGIPQVRVDFYEVDGKVLFGEMTFFTSAGVVPFESEEWDEKLGQMWDLTGHNDTQTKQI